MDCLISQMEKCIPEKLVDALVSNEHQAHLFLLRKAESKLFNERNFSLSKELAQTVLDATWELLNTRHWKEVPLHDRQIYTIASVIKILAMLHKHQAPSADQKEIIKNALQTADLSLLLGAPLSAPYDCAMMKVAQILTEALSDICSTVETDVTANSKHQETPQKNKATSVKIALESIPGIRGKALQCVEKPSLQKFQIEYFKKHKPAKLTGCISHWPALVRWKDMDYLRRVAGARTVPVELGAHYVDPDWSQKLMTFSDFLDHHVTSSGYNAPVGYLAQHPLFDQVPVLKADIYEPEYCCVSDVADDEVEIVDVNAWFGPKGTVSPLHQDPKHNLLSQVVGEKRIILYSPEDSQLLYPHSTTMLENTARVDPESPDYLQFPRFTEAIALECHIEPGDMVVGEKRIILYSPEDSQLLYPHSTTMLENTARVDPESPDYLQFPRFTEAIALECHIDPGDMVYIPPKWWHHVRSLSTSFSVSFWWT